jgi:thioredoxin-dependent peroxiredoxin
VLEEGDAFPLEALPARPEGPTVVYFYPADLTPGCTREADAFNTLYDAFREAGVEVVGVSTDSAESHDRFRNECGLRFPLVADEGGALTTSVGLMKDYGEYGTLAARVTLLLDADGVVRRVWHVDDVDVHPDDVLSAARELAAARPN